MFTLIEQGEVYGPEPLGKTSVLLNAGAILKIGEIDASSVERLGRMRNAVATFDEKVCN